MLDRVRAAIPISAFNELLEDHRKFNDIYVKPFVHEILLARRAAGELKPIPNCENRNCIFIDAWNDFIGGGALHEGENGNFNVVDFYANTFSQEMLMHSIISKTNIEKGASTIEGCHQQLLEKFTEGNCRTTWMNEKCDVSGENLFLRLKDWTPYYVTLTPERQFVPIGPIQLPGVETVSLRFDTPDLVISDWIRADKFTAAVRSDKTFSINSSAGRSALTQLYAEKNGFVSVESADNDPTIFLIDGVIVAASTNYLDENGNEFEEDLDVTTLPGYLGKICCNLWWTTVIEKAKLVSIMESAGETVEAAAAAIEEALSKSREYDNLVEVSVTTGDYTLYFCGDTDRFSKIFATNEIKLDPRLKPIFFLSPRPLVNAIASIAA